MMIMMKVMMLMSRDAKSNLNSTDASLIPQKLGQISFYKTAMRLIVLENIIRQYIGSISSISISAFAAIAP